MSQVEFCIFGDHIGFFYIESMRHIKSYPIRNHCAKNGAFVRSVTIISLRVSTKSARLDQRSELANKCINKNGLKPCVGSEKSKTKGRIKHHMKSAGQSLPLFKRIQNVQLMKLRTLNPMNKKENTRQFPSLLC